MRKILLSMGTILTLSMAGGDIIDPSSFVENDTMRAEIEALRNDIDELRAKINSNNNRPTPKPEPKKDNSNSNDIKKLEKKLKALNAKINKVKSHDAKDNIKWSVDLRTALDAVEYKMANGSTKKNDDIFSNRLWLNMAYNPSSNLIFKGQLAYNKAYGADMGNGRGQGYDQFDWVTNESLTNDTIKLRQAYWLYLGKNFLGTGIPWTASLGRRPSTTGFLSHLREDDSPQSPLGHNIDVEFDGGSALFNLEKLTDISGMSFKICAGQGGTNAQPRFASSTSYIDDSSTNMDDVRLAGFIFVPYDDGQFKLKTNVFKAYNLIGNTRGVRGLSTKGDHIGGAISLLVDGLNEDIDFLADTKVFVSYAFSQTNPDSGNKMLGSSDKESGNSYWVGVQFPVSLSDGKFGLEYNRGSKYWRSFTYAEDTMIGSKLATRGNAIEAYYTQPLTKGLSAQVRYTRIDYDYSGSNAFFGDNGTPMKISDINENSRMAGAIIDKSQDIRAYIRYRF
jgi:hypothetical protein